MQSTERKNYSNSQLQEFKALIEKKIKGSREELLELLDQMNTSDNEKVSLTDRATATTEKEYLSQQASRLRTYIQNLENALVRIGNKTYGICRVTGELIPKERLLAVPHATLCIAAKLKQSAA